MTIKTEKPLDYSGQVWRGIDDKFPKKIHNATTTSDGLMSAEDKAKLDAVDINDYNRVYDIASWENDGLLSKEDKKKLDGVEENANNYIHPDTPEIRHVTDEQISYWDAKASTDTATQQTNGLMSAEDKTKLDSVTVNATNIAKDIIQDENHRFVTDEQIQYWNDKASTDTANIYRDGLMSADDKRKLDNIEENANNYIHPNNEGIRHVSDAEKDYWNSKADKLIVTNSENGLMPFQDKIKLDAIEENANNYIHPDTPEIRHVTDEQIRMWNSKITGEVATYTKNGLMSFTDKIKLDSLSIHPNNHPATMIIEDETHRFVTDAEKDKWNNVSENIDIDLATQEKNGLMSKEDKKKLDELATSETYEFALSYTGWSTDYPYTQTINIPGLNPASNVYIGINPSATTEEVTTAIDAQLKVGTVEQDTITIVANGTKPDKNLPIIIMAGSSIIIFESNKTSQKDYLDVAPTTGYHYQNEIVYSNKPVQTKCIGWVCTNSGEPGDWVSFGDINI